MADVLVVDDNADIAECLELVLTLDGHRVRVASDGEQGMRALAAGLPDLVVLDVDMPILDGPGMACRMLDENCGTELIPVILSSATPRLSEIAGRIGTPYWIKKPFTPSELEAIVTRALAERTAPHPPPALEAP